MASIPLSAQKPLNPTEPTNGNIEVQGGKLKLDNYCLQVGNLYVTPLSWGSLLSS